jgi:hypothetical protein
MRPNSHVSGMWPHKFAWNDRSMNTNLRENEPLREQVTAWLKANGLNPGAITNDPIWVADGQIKYTSIAIDTTVSHPDDEMPIPLLDPSSPNAVLKVAKSVPVTVEPTGQVQQWLDASSAARLCPVCGGPIDESSAEPALPGGRMFMCATCDWTIAVPAKSLGSAADIIRNVGNVAA